MIKLKNAIDKKAVIYKLRKQAEKIYENDWQSKLQINAFMEGAKTLLNLLCLPYIELNFIKMERKIKEFKKFVTKQLENLVEFGEFDISVYVDDITDEAVELFAKQSSNKVRYPRDIDEKPFEQQHGSY